MEGRGFVSSGLFVDIGLLIHPFQEGATYGKMNERQNINPEKSKELRMEEGAYYAV